MNTHRNSATALAAAVIIIITAPSAAWADQERYDDHDRDGKMRSSKVNVHNNVHYNTHYEGRYPARGHYYYPPGYAYYPCSKCGKQHNHNNHDHDNEKLWIGLLGGGIVGYGLGVYQQHNTAEPYTAPPVSSAPPPPAYASTAPVYPCLQEREYRTKIMVGGKEVEGYGTACLQPDGSWRYGTTQPATY